MSQSPLATGFSLPRITYSHPTCPPESPSPKDNLNLGTEGFYIGSLSSRFRPEFAFLPYEKSSDRSTQSRASQMPPKTTSGKMTPQLQEHGLNSGRKQSSATANETGSRSNSSPSKVGWQKLMPEPSCATTEHCEQSAPITWLHRLSNGLSMFSGVIPAQENLDVHGPKPDSMHSLKIQGRSSGAVTKARSTWSWMSSEEAWTSGICCDGLIDTQSSLKLRAAPLHCQLPRSGSQATSTRDCGIQTATKKLSTLSCEGSTSPILKTRSTCPGCKKYKDYMDHQRYAANLSKNPKLAYESVTQVCTCDALVKERWVCDMTFDGMEMWTMEVVYKKE